MEWTELPPPSTVQKKIFKKRQGPSAFRKVDKSPSSSSTPENESLPQVQSYRPVREFCPRPFIPQGIRIVIPGPILALPPSAEQITNVELCRHNYAVIMRKMFHCPPRQERTVEIQMIKKPGSFLNMYFPYYGRVVLPVLELPTTFTVWVILDLNRKLIRVPLDHFLIMN